ncbi:hypothetical protein EPUS_06446 [Endocarpon pusillum Z07020]|uniref:Uncharacterized protein n=1 Tax=Endocarpon pusillum (strain Z07020 / HMAS-L-300199) TaxID=1263415 RepID=U1GYF1_ENDPU|nr:uncharacterized protein EPUS_06446 [Endocarpon pusillum Z07020]ERF77166.1 hypothetical protein EPUS_06446 [Endocarpon pusillum Z07020]
MSFLDASLQLPSLTIDIRSQLLLHNAVHDRSVSEDERPHNNLPMVDKEPASDVEEPAWLLNLSAGAPSWPDYPPERPWPKSDIVMEVYDLEAIFRASLYLLKDHSQSTETPYFKETQINTNAPYTAVRPGHYRTKPTGPGCKNSGCYWGSGSIDCRDALLALPAQTTAC